MDKLDAIAGNVYTGLEDAAALKIRRIFLQLKLIKFGKQFGNTTDHILLKAVR